jgi:predicted double-glycine peptidase
MLAGTIIGGTTPLGLARAAKQVGYDAKVIRHAEMEDLKDNLPIIVLINPGVLLGSRPSRHGHFLVVKEVKSDSLIVNDPMPIFGGENIILDLQTFLAAWEIMDSWLISIGGEKDGKDSSD